MSTKNKLTTQAHDAQTIAGIQKHLQNLATLPLAGSPIAPADLVKLIQSRTDLAATAASTSAAWHAAVAAEQALNTKLTPILRGLQQYVLNAYGTASQVLADFGFTAPIRKTPSPETLVAAAAKAKATRAARGTVGKVKKQAVKGNVKGVTVTPLTEQPAATPATAAAPSAGPAVPAAPAVTK